MTTDWKLLETFLSTPTAPFREDQIQALIEDTLLEAGVPHFEDPFGNIIVGAKSKAEYLKLLSTKSKEPLRIFIAHMDHPGFHGVEWLSPTELEVQWHGGSPVQHVEGAKVWLGVTGLHGYADSGILERVELATHGKAIHKAVVRFTESSLYSHFAPTPALLYGGFQFRAPVFQQNDCYYSKAADDLVGCFAIVELFRSHRKKKSRKPLHAIGLLTRAEEVGFIGAIEHFNLGWIAAAQKKKARDILAVSLETSRTLPGADIGRGPVVRIGDRNTVFDANRLQVLSMVAQKTLPNSPEKTLHQRRIMDGGSCEATAATAFGIPSIGLSVPLGNYHNQGYQGGPDCVGQDGPAPEFVHRDDVVGLLKLVQAIAEPGLPWLDPWKPLRDKFRQSLKSYRKLARTGRRE